MALAALTVVAVYAVFQLWSVLLLILGALIFTVGLLPYVEALVSRGLPRSIAVLAVMAAILAVVIGLFSYMVPALIDEVKDVRDNLPDSAREIEKLLEKFGVQVELQDKAREIDWQKLISGRAAVNYGQRVLNTTLSVLTMAVITAYLLVDMPKLVRFFGQFVPTEHEEDASRLAQSMARVVGGYLRGQFITSLIIGIYTFAVLRIIDVPNPLAFAVLAAFADIIPLVGAFIAIIPPVAAALQDSSGVALVVLVLLLLYQQFEDRFLVPRVYGQTLNLPPIIVLVAVLAGAELLGITGVLLALPLTAAGRVLLDYALQRRGMSLSPPILPVAADSADDAEEPEQPSPGRRTA